MEDSEVATASAINGCSKELRKLLDEISSTSYLEVMALKEFYPVFYFLANSDVRKTKKYSTPEKAAEHYEKYGKKEGRARSLFFDPVFYLGYYSDLSKAYKKDYVAALKHWEEYGIKEGRRGSIYFDPDFYLSNHGDLVKAYGKRNYDRAAKHWIDFGIEEGRLSIPGIDAPVVRVREGKLETRTKAQFDFKASTFRFGPQNVEQFAAWVAVAVLFIEKLKDAVIATDKYITDFVDTKGGGEDGSTDGNFGGGPVDSGELNEGPDVLTPGS